MPEAVKTYSRTLRECLAQCRHQLLAERGADAHWTGELSSSALSTATAVCALSLAAREMHADDARVTGLIEGGLRWLSRNANDDGGWGDTTRSFSNLSTTALAWAAFGAVEGADSRFSDTIRAAENWLIRRAGGLAPYKLAPAVINRYGKDRTFSVPILTMCALAGRLGKGKEAWKWVIPLPFELAAFPHRFYAALRLPVVSYALPALIAIGQARHHHRPSRNPIARWIRNAARQRTLDRLTTLQPSNGGFLEATPLTSFVVMSLVASGQATHPVATKGIEFLKSSAKPDGSWAIDTNLATWVTTLSVNALSGDGLEGLNAIEKSRIREWLLRQQYRRVHPYTQAAPGGWAWTDLPGGVPDADDTAGALIALRNLGDIDEAARQAGAAGVTWLLNLQNRDGGIPTFCRGWGALPFDRSSPDLTAHALRAWSAWLPDLPRPLRERTASALRKGLAYLQLTQDAHGAWTPLWFGNQHAPDDENPTYGTTRVLLALQELALKGHGGLSDTLSRGAQWLMGIQNRDGGWSGIAGGPSSVEETAMTVEALAGMLESKTATGPLVHSVKDALHRGVSWLSERIASGAWTEPAPIGFYFARLWYYERLYPQIFTVAASNRVERALSADAS